jgi:hypothetical protein
MRYASITLGLPVLLLSAAIAFAQNQPATLSRDAQHLANCMRAFDTACVVALSDVETYERVSPPGYHFAKAQTRFFDGLRRAGFKFVNFDVTSPQEIFTDGNRKYAFVPYTEVARVNGHDSESTAYFVAFSGDGGASWKFFDGANANQETIQLLIPSYSGPALPPVVTAVQSASDCKGARSSGA